MVPRRSPTPTRLKDSDFYVDLIFYAGILAYLTLARFFPAWLVAGFVILGGAAWLLTRRKAVVILCLRIIDVACGVIIFRNVPVIGFMLVVWAVVLAVVYRRRLAERVPRWWGDLRSCLAWESEMMSGMIWSGTLPQMSMAALDQQPPARVTVTLFGVADRDVFQHIPAIAQEHAINADGPRCG